MDIQNYYEDLKIKPGFFDPKSESEYFISDELKRSIAEIEQVISNSSTLYISGLNGIGKTTIKRYAEFYFDRDNTKVLTSHHLDDSYRIEDLYTAIILSINEKTSLTKKLIDRKVQADQALKRSNYSNFLFLIDNAELINKKILKTLIDFKKEINSNLGIVFFSEQNLDIGCDQQIHLQGLTEPEIFKYLVYLREKSENILPHMVSVNKIRNAKTFYDIIENVMRHAWERRFDKV